MWLSHLWLSEWLNSRRICVAGGRASLNWVSGCLPGIFIRPHLLDRSFGGLGSDGVAWHSCLDSFQSSFYCGNFDKFARRRFNKSPMMSNPPFCWGQKLSLRNKDTPNCSLWSECVNSYKDDVEAIRTGRDGTGYDSHSGLNRLKGCHYFDK